MAFFVLFVHQELGHFVLIHLITMQQSGLTLVSCWIIGNRAPDWVIVEDASCVAHMTVSIMSTHAENVHKS